MLYKITEHRVIIGALAAIIVGLLVLEALDEGSFEWISIGENLAAFLIGTATVTLLWEWFAKKSFFEEILDAVRLSSNIRDAGIERFSLDYKDFDWKGLFNDQVREIDIFFSYGQSWRNNYVEQVRSFARRDDVRMRVLLPNPQDDKLVNRLAERFKPLSGEANPEKIKKQIQEAADYFKKHFVEASNKKADLEVKLTNQSPQFAFYRFNGTAVVTFFNHLGRTGKVPCFSVSRGGLLFEFAKDEFDELFEQAESYQQKVDTKEVSEDESDD